MDKALIDKITKCLAAAYEQRIAELEAAIRQMHACIPRGARVDPQIIADELRAIANVAGVAIDD